VIGIPLAAFPPQKEEIMAQNNNDANQGGKPITGKESSKPPMEDPKHSQHDESDRDEKHRMGQFGQAGDHPRDTGRGSRNK
jgi:hypothetical protein